MKKYSFILFVLTLLSSSLNFAQQHTTGNDFLLNGPESWRKERLNLPLSFAPELNYNGIEFVRFAKGWGNSNSEEFWTYKFAWYLDEDPKITQERLNKELKLYFDGLLNAVGKNKGLAKEIITPTKSEITYDKDVTLFSGSVTIFDVFFLEATQTLNVRVIPTYCETSKKYIVYFEFSPQDFNHQVWETMTNIHIPCD